MFDGHAKYSHHSHMASKGTGALLLDATASSIRAIDTLRDGRPSDIDITTYYRQGYARADAARLRVYEEGVAEGGVIERAVGDPHLRAVQRVGAVVAPLRRRAHPEFVFGLLCYYII